MAVWVLVLVVMPAASQQTPPELGTATLATPAPSATTLIPDRRTLTVPVAVAPSWLPDRLFAWDGQDGSPSFTILLREKTGTLAARGLYVRPESLPNEALRPLVDHLSFTFNGVELGATERWYSSQGAGSSRDMPAGEPMLVRGELKGLQPGQYGTVLHFGAADVVPSDDDAGVQLSVNARHGILLPILVLVVALFISLVATKVLAGWRSRLELRARLAEIDDEWLHDEPQTEAVAWARALLNQANNLTYKAFLSGADEIRARLESAERLLKLLAQARDLRQKIHHSFSESIVQYRPMVELDQILRRLRGRVDEATARDLTNELKGLQSWFGNKEAVMARYWPALKPRLETMLDLVELSELPERKSNEVVKKLYHDLQELIKKQKTFADIISLERKYCRLKVLWDHRNQPEIFEKLASEKSLAMIFQIADHHLWHEQLEKAHLAKQLHLLSANVDSPGAYEAFEPILFKLGTGDSLVDDSFCFNYCVRTEWTIRLFPTGWEWFKQFLFHPWRTFALRASQPGKRKSFTTLTPQTHGPQIVQYAVVSGTLEVSATLHLTTKEGSADGSPINPIAVGPFTVKVDPSRSFGLLRSLGWVELSSLTITLIAAILTGLTTFYLNNPTFGNLADYLALFIWGFAADQTKNFIQALQGRSEATKAKPSKESTAETASPAAKTAP